MSTGSQGPAGWLVRPSLWFDAVCLIPLLAELDFYVSKHAADAALWQQRFRGAAGHAALQGVALLRQEIAERAGKPLPAFLALWTSPAAGSANGAQAELEQLIATVSEPDLLPAAMRERSDHWTAADDQLFRRVQPALRSVVLGIGAAGLPDWWHEQAEPPLLARCQALSKELAPYDLAALVEEHTRVSLPSQQIELCVLRWAAPHAIRVTGTRFLTDVRYDAQIVLSNAVHELLHPPWPPEHPVKGLLEALSDDPFLAARFAARDRDAGYNSWPAYVEEDAAQALDQLLSTRLDLAVRDPVTRWSTADGGMHVLALLLHDALIRAEFHGGAEGYADFLVRVLTDGKSWPDDLERRYREVTKPGTAGAL